MSPKFPVGTLNRWYYPQKESDPKNEVTPPSDIEQIYEKLQSLERFLKKDWDSESSELKTTEPGRTRSEKEA